MRRDRKPPLYRKVNTKARGVHHAHGGEYRWSRSSKAATSESPLLETMGGSPRRGLDYTPLFRFLLSKVGEPWAAVEAEARARLDRAEPITWLVATGSMTRHDVVWMGESSAYHGLFVDERETLRMVAPDLGPEHIQPRCGCCTYTLDGKPVPTRFQPRPVG